MLNAMMYKGYPARVDFDSRDNIFVGRILGISDIVGFHGETVQELTSAFHEAVDHYLEDCARTGRNPERPASGRLMLRIQPEVHAAVSVAAQIAGKSINQWAGEVLDRAASEICA